MLPSQPYQPKAYSFFSDLVVSLFLLHHVYCIGGTWVSSVKWVLRLGAVWKV